MFDQLKGIWKSLLCGIFIFPLSGEVKEESLDAVRVVKEGEGKALETRILSYEKEDVQVDLVGVVHLGEKDYYETLNKKLSAYDLVLYEMIGKGKPPKPGGKKLPAPRGDPQSEMAVVSQMYNLYTSLLDLELQKDVINYHRPNFTHADMTLREFQLLQEEKGETLMKFALQSTDSEAFSSIDQSVMLAAMISGNATALKNEFIKILGSADESIGKKDDSSVVVRARNEKCLRILADQLAGPAAPERVAIFYGAAHLPDFHKQLTADGWKATGGEWLTAWEVPAP